MPPNLNRPNLQGLVAASSMGKGQGDPLEAHRRAMTAQDKYNLDVQQAVAPIVAAIVWTPLTPTNNWVYQGSGGGQALATPAWYQDYSGRVWLKGSVSGGDSAALMFTNAAPAPSERIELSVITDNGAASILIRTDGTIYSNSNVVSGTGSLSLNGLTYLP